MQTSDKIYVAGHRGLVGSAICRALAAQGYDNLVVRSHAEMDLTQRIAVETFFEQERPTHVFLAAAKVGGIVANTQQAGDFIHENLLIQTHVIDAAYRSGVQKLAFLASSCIYPEHAPQPMLETCLLSGPFDPTHAAYASAKLAGKEMCDAYRRQFGFDAFTVVPCNVYGVGDNFHPEHSHVVAGLMRRFHEVKSTNAPEVVCWGTGTPLRELIFANDLGDACLHLMQTYTDGGMINAGSGQETSIRTLAQSIAETVGYTGKLIWDDTRPDGVARKVMDNSRLRDLGWQAGTDLRAGLNHMYQDFLNRK